MKKPERIVGFDVGTSGLKMTLADPATRKPCENLHAAYGDFREIAPGVVPVSVYYNAMDDALTRLREKYEIVSLAVTTQMYSVCAVENGETVAYQWNSLWDRKPGIEKDIADPVKRSGCRVDTLFPAYKLATLPRERRALFVPYGIKEAIIKRLTGSLAVDTVTASATGMFELSKRAWNIEFIRELGLDEGKLPNAVDHFKAVGKNMGTIVAPGLGDGPSASYACLDLSPFCGNLGTSMAARVFSDRADLSDEHGLWNFSVDDKTYVTGGISSNACSVLNWARNAGLNLDAPLPDTGEIRFFPWLHGERMPYWSSDLRGTVTGLRVSDGVGAIAGAVVKSVAFTFARMARVLEDQVPKGKALVMAGGGTNLTSLLDAVSGCLDTPMKILKGAEYLCSTGAVISAGKAIGLDITPDMAVASTVEPTGRFKREYERWLETAERARAIYD